VDRVGESNAEPTRKQGMFLAADGHVDASRDHMDDLHMRVKHGFKAPKAFHLLDKKFQIILLKNAVHNRTSLTVLFFIGFSFCFCIDYTDRNAIMQVKGGITMDNFIPYPFFPDDVPVDISFADSICTVKLTDIPLLQNQAYTVHIGAGAENAAGVTLGEDLSYDFTTEAGKVTAEITQINDGTNDITTFAGFTGDVKIVVDYENSTNKAQDMYLIVAQYKSDYMLAKAEIIKIDRTADVTAETIEVPYTAVAAEGAVWAKVMLWDSMSSLIPMTDSVDLGA